MRWLLAPLLLLCLVLPGQALNLTLALDPPILPAGGVVRLNCSGEGLRVGLARFGERVIPLEASPGGLQGLLGADVDLAPGIYPLEVVASDLHGRTARLSASVTVSDVPRPLEHLTLPPAMVAPSDPRTLERIAREAALLKELAERNVAPLVAGPFQRPVPHPVSSEFGKRRIMNKSKRTVHTGTDFRSPLGTPIASFAAGEVVLAGDLYYTGLTVVVDHGGGLLSLFGHLDRIQVQQGSRVSAGARLGTVGNTGRSTGAHLHWGVKLHGARVDPLLVLELLGPGSP